MTPSSASLVMTPQSLRVDGDLSIYKKSLSNVSLINLESGWE
jgi:hypothetical protein